jgi:hypothetical protein
MRHIAALILSLLVASGVAFAQEWRGVFVPDKGNRTDYLPKKGGFKQNADTTSYRFEFIVPAMGNTATMRLIPTKKSMGDSEDYPAVIVKRSEDMIVLVLVHTADPPPDKFEVYTLYPQAGVGFSTITSAYIGNPLMKALAATDPEIPVASASIFPLRRIDK